MIYNKGKVKKNLAKSGPFSTKRVQLGKINVVTIPAACTIVLWFCPKIEDDLTILLFSTA